MTPIPTYRPAAEAAARYRVIYGGAGSGKSVFVAMDQLHRCHADGRERVLVLRKVGRTCRGSTFKLLTDIVRAWKWVHVAINKTEMSLSWPSGAEIIHAGLDDAEKLKSITGITRIWIEEATELDFPLTDDKEPDLAQVDLRLRGIPEGMVGQLTITFNPTQVAAKIFDYLGVATTDLPTRSHKTYDGGRVYVQHTTYLDNPHVGAEYTAVFRRLGGVMQAVYERGELVAVDAPDQLIRYEWVKRAFEIAEEANHDGRQRMAIDVARFGKDDTVILAGTGYYIDFAEVHEGQDTAQTGRRAASLIREKNIPAELVGVDAVGLGAGTVDTMRGEGLEVCEIIAGASPIEQADALGDDPDFNNLRSQMWYNARRLLSEGRVGFSQDLPDEVKRKLQEDLLAPRYRFGSDRRIEVEPKDGRSKAWGIRTRLGRSPDVGDAAVMYLYVEHLDMEILVLGTI